MTVHSNLNVPTLNTVAPLAVGMAISLAQKRIEIKESSAIILAKKSEISTGCLLVLFVVGKKLPAMCTILCLAQKEAETKRAT